MTYADGAVEVESADPNGHTYALLSFTPAKLMTLHDTPEQAAA